MSESLYGEPLLAEVYDLFNAWGEDNDFYLGLCSPAVGSTLDLGCGTGLLAAKMAERAEVVGLDPARAMLDIARARPGGEQVEWRQDDARNFELSRRFDLIYCAGHAFQSFLTETDRRAVFRQVRRHLARGGRFAFETRNPAARAWLRWENAAPRRAAHPRWGEVELSQSLLSERNGLVSYRSRYRFIDQDWALEADARLRFCGLAALSAELESEGLRVLALHGDWRGGEWREGSEEIILTLSRDGDQPVLG
ncbi:class I SAM-dependent methyltransferase [Chromobacterium piscinae]|uniref:class I SAM-dependent methyltransferase n=1 Tax=Chromobacterium piscinae TaxID=686831 RepID=UPI001C8C6FEA|nr:class I SAM-dependent methyltransferase [Chromobacterium piscinae]MBX9299437.1 class I SAM-dependent methyltransferase [Chromobacterium vaccinii]MBX9356163.1 class I SAM-dependent methyltransferase [Chromobacterium vaccinii]MCD4506815.1 class I SAM-dependent methyltransferase [Chromobacterium piscinae]